MDYLGYTVLFTILTCILFTPIYFSFKKFQFVKLNLICIPVISILCVLGAFWPHLYIDLRLSLMGFDFNGMSDAERARNVVPNLRDEATKIYWSTTGVGWPLTAIMWTIILFPYPSLVWLVFALCKQMFGKNT